MCLEERLANFSYKGPDVKNLMVSAIGAKTETNACGYVLTKLYLYKEAGSEFCPQAIV